MFKAEINRRVGVVLVRVSGRFDAASMGPLDALVEKLAGREGPFDLILDFTGVTQSNLPVQNIAQRAERPPLWPGRERVLVAPQPILHALMRLFAGYQALRGIRRPVVVDKLDDALQRFRLSADEFLPLGDDSCGEHTDKTSPALS